MMHGLVFFSVRIRSFLFFFFFFLPFNVILTWVIVNRRLQCPLARR